jgi:hypothetical protein
MTTDEKLRKQVEHAYKIHQIEKDRLNKDNEGTWSWIKREIFFAGELTNWELFVTFVKAAIVMPFIVGGTWFLFAALYALTGVR